MKNSNPPTLLLYQGLPASGKSSEALRVVRRDSSWVRINSDDWRKSMTDGSFTVSREHMILSAQRAAVADLLRQGSNVLVDNTNLNPATVAGWERVAKETGAQFLIQQFNTDIRTCVWRDAKRTGTDHVGRHVIEYMALKAGIIRFDNPIILVDVDGTLANCKWRSEKYLSSEPKDWKGFFDHCLLDPVRQDVVDRVVEERNSYRNAYTTEPIICVITARPERCGKHTVQWLDNVTGLWYDYIFMPRRNDDHRPDTIVKQGLLKYLPTEKILAVFDDRPSVIRMWRDHGLRVIDVGDGKEF